MLKIFLALIFACALNAHSLKGLAKQDGEFIEIKSYFYASSPCKNCPISFLKDGALIASAKTDEKGFARVKLPASEFEILIDGGLAHEKRIKFSANEEELKNNASLQPNASLKFDESEEDFKIYALKFILSFLGIALFFGGIYLVKRRK